jgi:hypothetical protein
MFFALDFFGFEYHCNYAVPAHASPRPRTRRDIEPWIVSHWVVAKEMMMEPTIETRNIVSHVQVLNICHCLFPALSLVFIDFAHEDVDVVRV